MTDLIQVNEEIYYIAHDANYGVVLTGDDTCAVIDTGMDDDSAQLILAALDVKGLKLGAIINTHSHADHYGGNNYLVKETGCKVYAPALEAAIMQNPSLEPFYIYGADAPEELKQPFMMAKVSPVDELLKEPGLQIGNKKFAVISLKGHSPNQMGVMTEGVFFCSDALFSLKAWQRLILIYTVNVGEMIKSIERVKKVPARTFIPSHAVPTADITDLADLNIARIQSLADDILHIVREPATVDTILWEVNDKYHVEVTSLQQYYLCLNTLKAYLSYLLEEDLINYKFDANRLLWRTVE
ncbi:MAG: MBL fold metallo-hydrolase [Candidatus Aquicultor sp.]|nr:MBL fold metallo-hydrolase [Candidatus Aquicultor sp.]